MSLWGRKTRTDQQVQVSLGPLEMDVLDVLWSRGRSNVRQVAEALSRRLAYTTVMTTLDRLYKKGLLNRERSERAFFYVPAFSKQEWEQKRAGFLFSKFFSSSNSSSQLLISCLLDNVGQCDEALLDELERQISLKRRELEKRGAE